MKKNIMVIFGGRSTEHDISIITGVLAANSLDSSKYDVIPVYIDREGVWYTGESFNDVGNFKNFDRGNSKPVALLPGSNRLYTVKKNKLKDPVEIACALVCCHGLNGEDGSLSGLLQLCFIPYTCPSVLGSSVYMDKCVTKLVLSALKVKNYKSVTLLRDEYFQNLDKQIDKTESLLKFPVIVKPARLGSSIGIGRANNKEELKEKVLNAFKYDNKLLVEKAASELIEINCAAYRYKDNIQVSECIEQITYNDYLTFNDKYISGQNLRKEPELPEETLKRIQETTVKLYKALDLNGVVRADFIVDGGEVYFNEMNTIPGSLAYYMFCEGTWDMKNMLDEIIEESIDTYKRQKSKEVKFSSSILSACKTKGGKCLKKNI